MSSILQSRHFLEINGALPKVPAPRSTPQPPARPPLSVPPSPHVNPEVKPPRIEPVLNSTTALMTPQAERPQVDGSDRKFYNMAVDRGVDGATVALRRFDRALAGKGPTDWQNKEQYVDNLRNAETYPEVAQLHLEMLGYAPGTVDGVLGASTGDAVRAFQRDNGLAVDGIIGPNTRAALNREAQSELDRINRDIDAREAAKAEAEARAAETPVTAQQQGPETAEAQVVDDAVEALDDALATRDSAPLMIQHYFQGGVTEARADLESAVRDELDAALPHPFADVTFLDFKRMTGADVAARHAGRGQLTLEVTTAVGNVIVDVEVDFTLARVNAAPTPVQAFDRLTDQFSDVSDRAQIRILEDSQVSAVLDDVTAEAVAPLGTVSLEHAVTGVGNVRNLTVEADNPELAAEIVERALPAFDQAVTDYEGTPAQIMSPIVRVFLGEISDTITSGQRGDALNEELASFVINGARSPEDLIADHNGGTGVALDVTVIREVDATTDIDTAPLVENVLDNYEAYIGETVQGAFDDYGDHTAELNFYVGNFAQNREDVLAIIDDYVENAGPDWERDRVALFEEAGAHGERIFANKERIDTVIHLLEDGEDKLIDAASQDIVADAANFFANGQSIVDTDVDLVGGLEFLSTLNIVRKTAAARRGLANAHLARSMRDIVSDFEPNDPASIRQTAEAIRDLPNSRLERALDAADMDRGELQAGLNRFADLVEAGEETEEFLKAQKFYNDLEDELDDLDTLGVNTPAGRAIRGAGAILAVGFAGSDIYDFANDPNALNAATAFVSTATGAQTVAEAGTDFLSLADDSRIRAFGGNAAYAKLFGAAGLALGVPSIIDDFSNGEAIAGSLGAASVVTGGAATFAPKAGVTIFGRGFALGPWGALASAGLGAGLIGWGQHQRVEASNLYAEDKAYAALDIVGFERHAQEALADRSGEGFSPVPILMEYGRQHGLSSDETIDWLNSLSKDDLDTMRDAFHHTLDDIDGDIGAFLSYTTDDPARLARLERALRRAPSNVGVPSSRLTADWILERQGIPLPA
ncbi:MAG: peptidoglycan-binding domain-containing protein [Pseudomonadota bacterium]